MTTKSKHISNTEIEGVLEIDHNRGVIYFHNAHTATTMLRICQLDKPIPKSVSLIDITNKVGVSYEYCCNARKNDNNW